MLTMEQLRNKAELFLDDQLNIEKSGDHYYYYTDPEPSCELEGVFIERVLHPAEPNSCFDTLMEYLFEFYGEQMENDFNSICDGFINELDKGGEEYKPEEADMALREKLQVDPPYEAYLDYKYRVNIILDTGDGNYDYILNHAGPAYDSEGKRMSKYASMAWLAKQQGYKLGELNCVLLGGETSSKFLESAFQEVWNQSTHMNAITFAVELTLDQLIDLQELIAMQHRNGYKFHAPAKPYCGWILIDKETRCGLFDMWNGAGSLLELELEKDVKLPIKYIRSALPDSMHDYSIESVYMMASSFWKAGGVKEIHAPKKGVK